MRYAAIAGMSNVLLGTDFSVSADAALVQAANLAARTGGEVVVTHVRPHKDAIPPMLLEAYETSGIEATEAIAQALDERCETIRAKGARANQTILIGDPPAALAEYAASIGADLIVVGSLGKTGLERLLLGSVAERTVRYARTPVLIARADTGAAHGYRSIVVATDFSETADAALDMACEVATDDGRVELFHVMMPAQAIGVGFGTGPISPATTQKLQEWADEAARARIARHRSERVRLEFSSTLGPIAGSILDKLDERAFDLVVLGSHGRTGFKRLLLGSVAEKVIRHAPCSALVVPAAA